MVGSSDEEEEVNDLIQMIEELNAHTDLTVKLSNQSKLCKILELSPPEVVQTSSSRLEDASPEEPSDFIAVGARVKALLDDCKNQLEKLQSEKEQAIEEFLEHLAEEKFTGLQEIKVKYQKMLNLVKNAANKEEKTA